MIACGWQLGGLTDLSDLDVLDDDVADAADQAQAFALDDALISLPDNRLV